MADLANIAAAASAGYKETVGTHGANTIVMLEIPVSGGVNENMSMHRAYGEGANQAAAETVALAALNQQRQDRLVHKDSGGNQHTLDSK